MLKMVAVKTMLAAFAFVISGSEFNRRAAMPLKQSELKAVIRALNAAPDIPKCDTKR